MLKSYVKVAWRNLFRNKAFSLTNLLGLTIGISSTLMILMWVQNELSWDKFQANYKTIQQVYANRNFNGEIFSDNAIIFPLGDAMERQIPQVKHAVVTSFQEDHVLSLGDKRIKQSGYRVGKQFFNVFSWTFVRGTAETALGSPDAIILNETAAKVFFGNADPMNKVLRLDNEFDVKVTAIVKDAPGASTFHFDFITPYNYDNAAMQDWQNSYTSLYVQLQDPSSAVAVTKSMNAIIQKASGDSKSDYFFHPMPKWRLYSDFKEGKNTGGMIEYVRLFSIVGIVILLIACINFMNLSTARSERRAREVGIRKTLGSAKRQLILQFFMESVILTLIAFVLSVGLIQLLLPSFNVLVDKQLFIDFASKEFWLATAGIILLTAFFAGSYPALYLSSFNPVKVLKGTFLPGKAGVIPRKILVVGQFVVSILLICSTIIVYRQIQHVKNRSLGYRPDNLLMIPGTPELLANHTVIRQELINTGFVSSTVMTTSPITDIWNYTPAPDYEGKPANANMITTMMGTGEGFGKTIGIQMKEGRDFAGTPADSASMLLNAAAVKTMGLKNPIGMKMSHNNRNYVVTGVFENVVMGSPYKPVDPMMVVYRPNRGAFLNLRLVNGVRPKEALAAMEPIFRKYNPAVPFEYKFADQEYGRKFITEELIGKLANLFAGLAIFICCLGISGLAAFTIHKRTREIGIRKVLGATVNQVLFLVSKEFLLLVAIAFVISVPLTWWLMNTWLQGYAYRINIQLGYFAIAGMAVLILTLLTVFVNAIRAAVSNPVKAIRTE